MSLTIAENHITLNARALVDYNYSLEENSFVSSLNESFLEQKAEELEEIEINSQELSLLTLARLSELALLCAGNYADNFEFTATGDLLVNPRLILVHFRNQIRPVIKKRHTRLTDQFKNFANSGKKVTRWLTNEAFVETKKEPILPYLYNTLKGSGGMSQEYLHSIDRRMKKIADVIALLWSLHLPDDQDFHQWLWDKPHSERRFITSKLCNFNTRMFYDLGHDFHQTIQFEGYKSKFLC